MRLNLARMCLCLITVAIAGGLVQDEGKNRKLHHSHNHNHHHGPNHNHLHCPNCLRRTFEKELKSEADRLRLETIKRQILAKLGMREKPNVTQPLPREFVERTYRTISGEGLFPGDADEGAAAGDAEEFETVEAEDEELGRTSEVIAFAERGYRLNGNRLLEFRINADLNTGHGYRVKAATLWVRADVVRPRSSDRCRTTNLYVFKFRSMIGTDVVLTSQQFTEVTEDPVSVPLDEAKPGWQRIDVKPTVEAFLKRWQRSDDRLKLFVDCSCCADTWTVHVMNDRPPNSPMGTSTSDTSTSGTTTSGSPSSKPSGTNTSGSSASGTLDPNRPFLVVEIDPAAPRRVRRRSTECPEGGPGPGAANRCCKQPFYVSFEKLGWREWIIAPSGYYANYCRGECGHHRTPDTYVNYHTHVIEQFRKNHHLSGVQPCCAPLKFSGISLIYYDTQNNIIKRDLPKMVVDDCGCP